MSLINQLLCRCFIVMLTGCALGCIGVSGGGKKGADSDVDASMSLPDGSVGDAASADSSLVSDAGNDVLAADAPATTDAVTEPPTPPCPAYGAGAVSLQMQGGASAELAYTGDVTVQATHLEPDGCLTGMTLGWARAEGCGLTLSFIPGEGGIWGLESAIMAPGDGCGSGGVASGLAVLSGVPDTTASSLPPTRCTVLSGAITVYGSLSFEAGDGVPLSATLDGLQLDGMLLSNAVESGICGVSYTPCVGQSCGDDALLGTSCGACPDGSICENGQCQEVEEIVAVCKRVLDDRADLSEGEWLGNAATCDSGVMSADWQARALKLTNLYRWLAGQPPLELATQGNVAMQDCAVMMHAAGNLSHNPGENWPCYTEDGKKAAGGSNLAPVPAVEAIDLYMADPGNDTTIGHRRWILSDWISKTAFGSTSDSSCMRVAGGFGGPNPWIAWPPPGFYPMEMHHIAYKTVDQTGWTIQTNDVSLQDAVAEVKENGQVKPIEAMTLLPNYGSKGAFKITPAGWKIQAGSTYEVHVTTASSVIEYSFVAVDCGALMNQ